MRFQRRGLSAKWHKWACKGIYYADGNLARMDMGNPCLGVLRGKTLNIVLHETMDSEH